MKSRAIAALYCAVLCLLSIFAYRTPKPGTWDILAYTASAEAARNNDFIHLHRYAYAQLQAHSPAANFADITQSGDYRRKIAADPVLFGTALQYYSIRPLYVIALRVGRAVGIDPVRAAGLIAALSYFVIGLIAFLWMRMHIPDLLAAAASLLLMLTYPLLLIARLYTPDAMATGAIVAAAWLIFARRWMLSGLALLVAAVYIRTDTCIFAGFVLAALVLTGDRRIRLRWSHAAVLVLLTAASVLTINHFSGNYGYASLMHNQFVNESDMPDAPHRVSLALYLKAVASTTGLAAALRGFAAVFLLLGSLAFIRVRTPLRDLAYATLLTGAAHFVIFPYFHDRLFAGEYILFAITAVCTVRLPAIQALRPASYSSEPVLRPEAVEISPALHEELRQPRRA